MSFLDTFEKRVSSVFGASNDEALPFSFKKLAKQTLKELKNNLGTIDKKKIAPGLFTILVSSDDDALMRPYYNSLTSEISQFVIAYAQEKKLQFVGEPLVRFMVDLSLKRGRFFVFAENVNAQILDYLRQEEAAFAAHTVDGLGGAASVSSREFVHKRQAQATAQTAEPELAGVAPQNSGYAAGASAARDPRSSLPEIQSSDSGLDLIPDSFLDDNFYDPASQDSSAGLRFRPASGAAQVNGVARDVAVAAAAGALGAEGAQAGAAGAAQGLSALGANASQVPLNPPTMRRNVPLVNPRRASTLQNEAPIIQQDGELSPQAGAYPAAQAAQAGAARGFAARQENRKSCLLVDRKTGKTYTAFAPQTYLGRERAASTLVLKDPNISRRHAELYFKGSHWGIVDLNSTNGTQVNGRDIQTCILRDGDTITLGLMQLEFREN